MDESVQFQVPELLDRTLFSLGETPITIWTIGLTLILTVALFVATGMAKRRLSKRALARTQLVVHRGERRELEL